MKVISKSIAEKVLAEAKSKGLVDPKANYFYSKEALNYRLNLLNKHFPKKTLHAIAIKTNNHPEVLEYIVNKGFGLEAASIEEVKLAQNAGISTDKIVFDSPVKTREEIEYCHKNIRGALINVNCLEEIKRYPRDFSCKLGLRINPLIDVDTDNLPFCGSPTSVLTEKTKSVVPPLPLSHELPDAKILKVKASEES